MPGYVKKPAKRRKGVPFISSFFRSVSLMMLCFSQAEGQTSTDVAEHQCCWHSDCSYNWAAVQEPRFTCHNMVVYSTWGNPCDHLHASVCYVGSPASVPRSAMELYVARELRILSLVIGHEEHAKDSEFTRPQASCHVWIGMLFLSCKSLPLITSPQK